MEREEVCTFALGRIFMHESLHARQIISALGSASEIFSLDRDGIYDALGPFNRHSAAIADTKLEKVEDELNAILVRGGTRGGALHYLACCSPAFPYLLNQCEDAPTGLFVESCDDISKIFSREMVAVVGTRDSSPYGEEWCGRIAGTFASSDVRPTIVSGLAYGIDIRAHTTALDEGLPTIAVLGTGIDVTYPRHHESFAGRICRAPLSALVSEYAPGTEVLPVNFLYRNRIVAGMSRATILVESRIKGGGMTTAGIASSYNRDVYALPGRTDDLRSQGCNSLLHSHIAEPVISCEALLKSFEYKRRKCGVREIGAELSRFYSGSFSQQKISFAQKVVEAIKSRRGITPDEISEITGAESKDVLSLLVILESDGFISMDLLQRCSLKK